MPLRVANIGLHGATLAARFLLIFFLARYLEPEAVGLYGLFTATIGYSLFFVGLDFYIYTTRELIKADAAQRGALLKNQASLCGLLYLAFIPVAVLLLDAYAQWTSAMLFWYVPLLAFEHLNQEINRLLIALSQPVFASVLLFIRQGSWPIALVMMMEYIPATRSATTVYLLWTGTGALALVIGVWKLMHMQLGGWCCKIDWPWIRKGVGISLLFLAGTLALRSLQTFDRYWLQALTDTTTVGAYILFFGIASTLMTFLDAGVFAFALPAIIRHFHAEEKQAVAQLTLRMAYITIALSCGFAAVSWLSLPYLLAWIGNPLYQQLAYLYPWLLSAMVFNALGMIPHFTLYASGADKLIITGNILAVLIFMVFAWRASESVGALAVPLGLNIAFGFILAWKTVGYRYLIRSPRLR